MQTTRTFDYPDDGPVQIGAVARTEIESYLSTHGEDRYPESLIGRLRVLGVFGATIPRQYGGLEWAPGDVARLVYELARGWQPLAGLVGTHLRLCREVFRHGTAEQRSTWLPAMAAGDLIFARAYHESGVDDPDRLRSRSDCRGPLGTLNGHKDWVTNARHADRIVAIAREGGATLAVVVDPRRRGVAVGDELPRPGMRGVSLAGVTFSNYEFDPDRDVLGGRLHDVAGSVRAHDMTGYVSRALGSADAVVDCALRCVRDGIERRSAQAQGAIRLRVGELCVQVSAMRAVWLEAIGPAPSLSSDEAKVFCTSTLKEVIGTAAMLCGGAGYAGSDGTLGRHYRDALALQIVGAPNDALLGHIGERALTG